MTNNIYIQLQGFITINNISYKKIVKILNEFSAPRISCEDFLTIMSKKSLKVDDINPSQNLKKVVAQLQEKNEIKHPLMMDHLMDVIEDFGADKKFLKFLEKHEKPIKTSKLI